MAIKRKYNKVLKTPKVRLIVTLISAVSYWSICVSLFKISFFYMLFASIVGWNGISLKLIAVITFILPTIGALISLIFPHSFLKFAQLYGKIPWLGKGVKKSLKGVDEKLLYEPESDIEQKMRIRSEKLEDILEKWNIRD